MSRVDRTTTYTQTVEAFVVPDEPWPTRTIRVAVTATREDGESWPEPTVITGLYQGVRFKTWIAIETTVRRLVNEYRDRFQ
jgi:hypothetical protein